MQNEPTDINGGAKPAPPSPVIHDAKPFYDAETKALRRAQIAALIHERRQDAAGVYPGIVRCPVKIIAHDTAEGLLSPEEQLLLDPHGFDLAETDAEATAEIARIAAATKKLAEKRAAREAEKAAEKAAYEKMLDDAHISAEASLSPELKKQHDADPKSYRDRVRQQRAERQAFLDRCKKEGFVKG